MVVMKDGALDYITRSFENDKIESIVSKALRFIPLQHESKNLKLVVNEEFCFSNFIGEYETIKKMSEQASRIAAAAESGTEKEFLVRLIHYNSERAGHPFIALNRAAYLTLSWKVNCSVMKKRAFIIAHKQKSSRFALAD